VRKLGHAALLVLVATLASAVLPTMAEPTSAAVMIKSVRVYNVPPGNGPGFALVQVATPSICSTDTYKIDLAWGGSRETLATALSAFNADQFVLIEAVGSQCNGWGSLLQSIYIVRV
jgi:hypothetical protein